jgi:outer membrane lipoprotein SlyB
MFSKSRVIFRLIVVVPLLFSVLVGCAGPHMLPDTVYEAKQVQQFQKGSLETTYVICKSCIQYTKLIK